ncbi:MAG: HAMP domain-containing histidine kinase [Eubacterium sp.]|nr:HAMP domain-containing histidine kinase [Eubacterium sp.]
MKKNGIMIIIVLLLEVLLAVGSNFLFLRLQEQDAGREYRVEIARVSRQIQNGEEPDISSFQYVKKVEPFDGSVIENDEYTAAVGPDGTVYRISYRMDQRSAKGLFVINLIWGVVFLLTIAVGVYIYRKILKPFRDLSELPIELSKGNLSIPLKEEKNRYFGRYLWGMDMLREKLEEEKERRLAMEQEKKTLVLTVSHDIKTPLSAIKLYNKALASGIYEDEEKRREAHRGIDRNLDELEKYVEEIRDAAREDFLQMHVKEGEWYLSEVMNKVDGLYAEKAGQVHTKFVIDPYTDCILKGDPERALEVMQNILENALKYGDGRRISIRFSDEEECRLVTVENTGSSLPERELPNIFDSFYRGSNSEKQRGSGLGLYICRKIMQAMDGEIFAEVKKNATEDIFAVTAVFRKR